MPTNGSANVSNGTRREVVNAFSSGRIHDVLFPGVACRGTKWTALLSVHSMTISTSLFSTVVYSTEGVPGFVAEVR